LELLFFFFVLKIVEHLVGEKTAKHPKMQMVPKIEPIRGFLQGIFSVVMGGKKVIITLRNRPSTVKSVRYVMSELVFSLGDTNYSHSE
jgi:hypothetical protein